MHYISYKSTFEFQFNVYFKCLGQFVQKYQYIQYFNTLMTCCVEQLNFAFII